MNDSDRLIEINERLAMYISEFFGKPIEEVRNQLTENLMKLSEVLPQKENLINNIKKALEEKDKIENDQKLQEAPQKFLEVEKRVLASLSPAKRKKVETMRQYWLDNDGDYFETSYRQFILMTDRKEVIEMGESVQFLYAHKELYRQELQLPKKWDESIFDCEYTWYTGDPIIRREIRQHVLDKDDDDYHYIQEAQEELAKDGKYIATEENTFNAIFSWFEWTTEQKIKTMQYFTEFVGWGIISEEDKNGCCRLLKSGLSKCKCYTFISGSDDPDSKGSLFIAKNC